MSEIQYIEITGFRTQINRVYEVINALLDKGINQENPAFPGNEGISLAGTLNYSIERRATLVSFANDGGIDFKDETYISDKSSRVISEFSDKESHCMASLATYKYHANFDIPYYHFSLKSKDDFGYSESTINIIETGIPARFETQIDLYILPELNTIENLDQIFFNSQCNIESGLVVHGGKFKNKNGFVELEMGLDLEIYKEILSEKMKDKELKSARDELIGMLRHVEHLQEYYGNILPFSIVKLDRFQFEENGQFYGIYGFKSRDLNPENSIDPIEKDKLPIINKLAGIVGSVIRVASRFK